MAIGHFKMVRISTRNPSGQTKMNDLFILLEKTQINEVGDKNIEDILEKL